MFRARQNHCGRVRDLRGRGDIVHRHARLAGERVEVVEVGDVRQVNNGDPEIAVVPGARGTFQRDGVFFGDA
jgi:putative component of toxin-antitoxin plasmid stabilization module